MDLQQAKTRAQEFANQHGRPIEVILHRTEGYEVGKYADGLTNADISRVQYRPELAQIVCIMQPEKRSVSGGG